MPTPRARAMVLGIVGLAAAAGLGPQKEASPLRALAQERYEAAEKVAEFYRQSLLAPPGAGPAGENLSETWEQITLWSLRSLEAELDLAETAAERIACLSKGIKRLEAIESVLQESLHGGNSLFTRLDLDKAHYLRLDWQYRLEREKARQP